jgi:hypothetical protein
MTPSVAKAVDVNKIVPGDDFIQRTACLLLPSLSKD